ncbi:MAG: hypothetical protein IH805_01910 [Proteobacteria bacterium]|nr:hypothetical protein [Pseudomonadota bacterium]
MIAMKVTASKIRRSVPLTRCSASAAEVPITVASTAVVPAMMRLVVSASITHRFETAVPYHWSEKPRKSLACRPALKLNSTMMPMGTYRKR